MFIYNVSLIFDCKIIVTGTESIAYLAPFGETLSCRISIHYDFGFRRSAGITIHYILEQRTGKIRSLPKTISQNYSK